MGEADEQAQPSDAQIPLNDVEMDQLLRKAETLAQEVVSLSGVEEGSLDDPSGTAVDLGPTGSPTGLAEGAAAGQAAPAKVLARGPLEAVEEIEQQILSVEDILANADMATLAAEYEAARTETRAGVVAEVRSLDVPADAQKDVGSPSKPAPIDFVGADMNGDTTSDGGANAMAAVAAAGIVVSKTAIPGGLEKDATPQAASDVAAPEAKTAPSLEAAAAPRVAKSDTVRAATPPGKKPPTTSPARLKAKALSAAKTTRTATLLLLALPLNMSLVLLVIVNYPFRKLPAESRRWVGLLGILTLIMGILAFVLPNMLTKNPYEQIAPHGTKEVQNEEHAS